MRALLLLSALLVVAWAADGCAAASSAAACTALGSAAEGPGACIWCAPSNACHEPEWAGRFSCPCANASCAGLYGCAPGATEVRCGSSCHEGGEPCAPWTGSSVELVFSLTLFGACNETASAFTCQVEGASEQTATLIDFNQVDSSTTALPFGRVGLMQSTGTYPAPGSYDEQGTFGVDGTVLFKFAGTGTVMQTGSANNTQLMGSGHYTVTGMAGAYANLDGVMTALFHLDSLKQSTRRIVVHFASS